MFITPSPEQREIITSQSKLILVEANAGAAKTTTAAMRIWELIKRGSDPSKILALSFSLAGVQAFRDAFQRIGMPWELHTNIQVLSVDEFCRSKLRRLEAAHVRSFNHKQDLKHFVVEAIREARNKADDKFPGEFWIQGSGELSVESLLDSFYVLKGSLAIQRFGEYFRCTPSNATELGTDYTTLAVFLAYEKNRCSYDPRTDLTKFRFTGDHTYDFARHLLSEDPSWNYDDNPLALNLHAVVLDEMHDIGWAIFTVLRQLLQYNPQASFLGVADRDQVLYQEYGADSYFIGPDLDRELGQVKRYPLSKTYRYGNDLAQPMGSFSNKKILSTDVVRTSIRVEPAADDSQYFNLVAEFIHRYTVERDNDISNIAMLMRHPGISASIEHALFMRKIPYTTVGFKPFLQRPEVAFIRMLLSIAVDHNTFFENSTLIAAKYAVCEFVGFNYSEHILPDGTPFNIDSADESTFKHYTFPYLLGLAEMKISQNIYDALELAKDNDSSKIIEFAKTLRIKELLEKVFVSTIDIQEAMHSIEGFAKLAMKYPNTNTLLRALNAIDMEHSKSTKNPRLRLSTIPEAKGLEFLRVIIPDCNTQYFDGAEPYERNLFYVAATRARESLLIIYNPKNPSSYLQHFR